MSETSENHLVEETKIDSNNEQNPTKKEELKEIQILQHKFLVDNILTTTEEFDMYKIHDDLKREFALKIIKNQNIQKSYINCLNILKNKPCVAAFFEYEIKNSQVHVVFELGQPVDVYTIPKNLIKRRLRQILMAISSISEAGLHFADLNIEDFMDTNGGIRLIHFEHTLTNINKEDETTFEPCTHLLNEIFEGRKNSLDQSLYKDLKKCVDAAKETEIKDIKELINSQFMRDTVKVTFHKSNRAMTPDPHNLVLMKKRRPRREESPQNPVLMKKIKVQDMPPPSYLNFLGIGIFLSIFFVAVMQCSLTSTTTFTGLALKLSWIALSVCISYLIATYRYIKAEDDSAAEYMIKLQKWCRGLVVYILLTVGFRSLEFTLDTTTIGASVTLFVWLIASYLV